MGIGDRATERSVTGGEVAGVVLGGIGALTGLFALVQQHRHAADANAIQDRVARIEEDRRTDEVTQHRGAQAELVSCWIDFEMLYDVDLLASQPTLQRAVRVHNASEQPVLNVAIVADPGWIPGREPEWWFDVIAPRTTEVRGWDPDTSGAGEVLPILCFTDAAGVDWHRDRWGRLREGGWTPTP